MKVHLKGGVWKNTEDEILKAAVMKYGKTQWARISSLLVRKTPKQCKARWYEWLDPSIKKTEWTREEDEKLLNMAKMMPTQWRTIAPIVGRAPAQCLERYQRLLDEAEARAAGEDDGLGLQGEVGAEGRAAAGAGAAGSDARRLRPGEIDPHPETKPARPDPVDMDEDEKDMLSEARARLANTQGKKAKRKARERQLEEARRLATLQKRRELKAAGIEIKAKKKKDKHHMNYNMEIPYERKPAPGFYDTTEELERRGSGTAALKGRFLHSLEAKSQAEREEDSRREARRKREAKAKDGIAFVRASDQRAADEIAAREEVEQAAKRPKLMLPAPQVSDGELAAIAKLGQQGALARELVDTASGGGGGSTDALLGTYSATPQVGAVRTPRVPAQSDRIMNEALAQRAMAAQSTPLLGGGDGSADYAVPGQAAGLRGAQPPGGTLATPNPLATPLRAGLAAGPGMTAVRDELGLNTPAPGAGAGATSRERKAAARGLREQLARKLAAIPEPKNEFEIVVPEPAPADKDDAAAAAAAAVDGVAALRIDPPAGVEDQADIDQRLDAERRCAAELELQRRSQSVKRGLPRPDMLADGALVAVRDAAIPGAVLDLIGDEMRALVLHDAHAHPVPDAPPLRAQGPGAAPALEELPDDILEAARRLVEAEMAEMLGEMRSAYERLAGHAGDALWGAAEAAAVWLPQAQAYAPTHTVGAADWIEKHRRDLASRREAVAEEAARAAKTERKLGVALGGYQARAKALGDKIRAAHQEYEQARLDADAFARLHTLEQAAIPARIEKAEAETRAVEAREAQLQAEYQALLDRRNRLVAERQ
ncbi:Pre-mRNA-splicing factor cef1 [Coemansia javaensis]|uniref:Pre-mRNA-splicing factor cef1 n=1 Tax=Coemansia javaensis TaxID=2761396 RepID=A0A9W8HAD0_9FUNG|nr:Pre-mRNA-splicing factor cef1 [Coemansia javaensis]